MKIKTVEFDPVYIPQFIYRGSERRYLSLDDREIQGKILEDVLLSEEVGVILLGEEVVSFMGIQLLSKGVGEGWMYLNPVPKTHALQLVREIYRFMLSASRKLGLVRLQSLCLPISRNRRFLEVLGFRREATLQKYFNGLIDVDVYVIFFGSKGRCQRL